GADDPVRAVLAGQRCTAHVRAASAVICQSGAIELALTEARDHARRSQAALTTLPDNDARQVLWSLVDYALARSQ
ncbi:MAG: hypothetical protein KJ734_08015, partial [Chloroflexi bacterium]|nr:hypothetical protein [Chloroflexota bacterium]